MTARGRCLVLAALTGLCLGVLRGQPLLSLVSLSVLVWLLAEWLLFSVRVSRELSHVQVRRLLGGRPVTGDAAGTSGLLWAGRTVVIRVEVTSPRRLQPLTVLQDVVPEILAVPDGGEQCVVAVASRQLAWTYSARVLAAGEVFLPGVRVTLQDRQGLFRCDRFVAQSSLLLALPAFAEAGDIQPLVKRVNALPQHGIHRLQRAGLGSELLELREYVVGDPPKSIAWKVSARRDRLMTRQYESEVPVRVQLFLDGSISTRLGGFGARLLDQLTWVGASIARAAISVGDPVGAVLLDERGSRRVPCGNGERSFQQLLKALAEFSTNPAPPPLRLTDELIHAALQLLNERFPELLDQRCNRPPWTWLPVLPRNRRRFHERWTLAAALADVYRLTEEKQIQLTEDNGLLALYLQHFLSQSGWAWMEPVVTARGRSEQDGLPRMQQLSAALLQAVAHARDNEVFVILADLLECAPAIAHLLPAIKLALARHHRVAVVCPSPTFRRPTPESTQPASAAAADLLLAAEQIRIRDLFQRLQRELGRLGAAVTVCGEPQAVRMVLAQMDLARSGRLPPATARVGGRS